MKFLLTVFLGVLISGSAYAESRMAGSQVLSAGTIQRRAEEAKQAEIKAREESKQAAKQDKQQPVAVKETAAVAPAAGQKQVSMPEARQNANAKTVVINRTSGPKNYVGQIEMYKARGDDTLLSIGEANALGYVEIRSANPAADPWKPGAGTTMILPKMHLLPDAPRKGIVVNLSEMRLYYYPANGGETQTFPIGVGREGFTTPIGSTTVTRKTIGPTWRPTDRMRREDPRLPVSVGPGPDNPLGTHALYLGWPQYLLHGTNKPWGIGRRVSSGCVRMYNSSAEYLYNNVPTGTLVTTVRQPVKFGWVNNMLYIEAHPDEMLADQAERSGGGVDYKVPPDIFANLSRAAGKDARDLIDWRAVREALRKRTGYPVPILQGAKENDYFVNASMEARAGTATTRFKAPDPEDLRPLAVQPAAQTTEQAAAPAEMQQTGSTRRSRLSRFN